MAVYFLQSQECTANSTPLTPEMLATRGHPEGRLSLSLFILSQGR